MALRERRRLPVLQAQSRGRSLTIENNPDHGAPSIAQRLTSGFLIAILKGRVAFAQDMAEQWQSANRLLLERYTQWAAQKAEAGG